VGDEHKDKDKDKDRRKHKHHPVILPLHPSMASHRVMPVIEMEKKRRVTASNKQTSARTSSSMA
jgi:hypothetical protein